MLPTVIAHRDVRDNLLQDRLPFHKFLVLGFCGLKIGAKFLHCKL